MLKKPDCTELLDAGACTGGTGEGEESLGPEGCLLSSF